MDGCSELLDDVKRKKKRKNKNGIDKGRMPLPAGNRVNAGNRGCTAMAGACDEVKEGVDVKVWQE
jgi:hypothetical protein